MKGKNWREEASTKRPHQATTRRSKSQVKHAPKRRKKRKKSLFHRMVTIGILFCIGYFSFTQYYFHTKPYTIAIDFGHGGEDVGAVGLIQEIEVIEKTGQYLADLLRSDGRFHVILSRKIGQTISITDRNKNFRKSDPDLVLSLHANASTDPLAYGFECYPSPPGSTNYDDSMDFARAITAQMNDIGVRLRGENGIRFGYYVPVENKVDVFEKYLVDASDTEIYPYTTFGILTNMMCPAVLVEQCFITNEDDVLKYCSDEGAMDCAKAYYLAIVSYLESVSA